MRLPLVLAVACRIFSCSSWAQLPHSWGMLVPGPGIEPIHVPCTQGGFLTTGPLGRSLDKFLELSRPRGLQMQSGMDQQYVRMNWVLGILFETVPGTKYTVRVIIIINLIWAGLFIWLSPIVHGAPRTIPGTWQTLSRYLWNECLNEQLEHKEDSFPRGLINYCYEILRFVSHSLTLNHTKEHLWLNPKNVDLHPLNANFQIKTSWKNMIWKGNWDWMLYEISLTSISCFCFQIHL